MAALQEAIDADPDDYSLYFNRAAIAVRAGDRASARRDYLAPLERIQRLQAPSDGEAPDLLEHKSHVLFYLGREKEAAGALQRLLQLEPDRPSVQRGLGYVPPLSPMRSTVGLACWRAPR